MASSSYELQVALRALLLADTDVSAAVGARIYDGPPADVVFPYLSFGPSYAVPDDAQCIDGVEEVLQVDVWARDDGKVWPCRDLVAAVRRALHRAEVSLATHACALCRVELSRVLDDPDGITKHGVVQVSARLEEA